MVRTDDGRVQLAAGAAVLGSRFASKLREVAQPQLRELAKRARATAFLSVAEHDECVVVSVAEPEEGMLRDGYGVGSRHPIDRGAAGIAVLASRPEAPDDSEEARHARREGYSLTRGQIEHGAVGIAAGLRSPLPPDAGGFECSIGVVAIDGFDTTSAAAAVVDAASRIKADMGI